MGAVENAKETAAVELGALLDAGANAVVTLVAGDTRLMAHRAVLAARSPVFSAMFDHDTLEAVSGQVSVADVEGLVLRQLLEYCYTLQAPQRSDTAPQLLAAADKYGLSSLKAQCEQRLITELAVENAAAVAVLAVRHSCSSLRQSALTFIGTRPLEVMATKGWADAMREQPEDLIQVSQLLYNPPPESRAPAATGDRTTNATAAKAAASVQTRSASSASAAPPTPPSDEATISRIRSLYPEERGRRLIEVAQQGAVEEVKALLSVGVDVGARGWGQRTALHWAAMNGHVEAGRCLLQAGAEVDARNSAQRTPLHFAACRGHLTVVQLLLHFSADPDARDCVGTTPLHDAAFRGRPEVVAALLEAGADSGARTNGGKTPRDVAKQELWDHLTDMLR